jgi:putative oxidoreductase
MAEAASHIAVSRAESSSSNRIWRTLLFLGRLVLGGIFVYAAYAKVHFDGAWHLRDYQFFFAMGINSYNILPLSIVQWMARILPWLEFVLGALVILGIGLRWASLGLTALLVVFMVALTRAAMLGLQINCGCFGYNSPKPSTELWHDSGFVALAIAVTVGAFLARRVRRTAT